MCSRISLTKREQIGISVEASEVEEARVQCGCCLVGKICTEKVINKEAFKSVLTRLWRTTGRVVFKEVQEKLWLFEFTVEVDKRRVLEGRSWSFDKQIIVLNDFEGKVLPSQMDFGTSPFWVQVHDMPLICMTRGWGAK